MRSRVSGIGRCAANRKSYQVYFPVARQRTPLPSCSTRCTNKVTHFSSNAAHHLLPIKTTKRSGGSCAAAANHHGPAAKGSLAGSALGSSGGACRSTAAEVEHAAAHVASGRREQNHSARPPRLFSGPGRAFLRTNAARSQRSCNSSTCKLPRGVSIA